jgi:hypothetical protein
VAFNATLLDVHSAFAGQIGIQKCALKSGVEFCNRFSKDKVCTIDENSTS